MHPVVQAITTDIFGKLDMPIPDSVNLNLYQDGQQSVNWHADDEPLFACDDVRIFSLSLGQAREFQIVSKENMKSSGTAKFKFGKSQIPRNVIATNLGAGDFLIMAGGMQNFYLHRIPADSSTLPRVNLTWRYIKQHACGHI